MTPSLVAMPVGKRRRCEQCGHRRLGYDVYWTDSPNEKLLVCMMCAAGMGGGRANPFATAHPGDPVRIAYCQQCRSGEYVVSTINPGTALLTCGHVTESE